jgi:hypothetical protein
MSKNENLKKVLKMSVFSLFDHNGLICFFGLKNTTPCFFRIFIKKIIFHYFIHYMETKNSEMEIEFSENSENNSTVYNCKICDYICSKKQHIYQHLKTQKHIFNIGNLVSKNGNNWKPCEGFGCKCGKQYTNKSGLWKHKKKCNYSLYENSEDHNPIQLEKIEPSTNEIIELMKLQMIENQELRRLMLEQQKQIYELASKTGSITNTNTNCNNNTNSHNNTFNLQVFLNEQCKNALNINEFVDTIKMKMIDLENVGQLGYVEGLSRIFIKGLNDLDTCKRPIHCSDLKREVLYIKDNNCWQKETDDKPLLKNAIRQVANKNIKQIPIWRDSNPGCCQSDSNKNDQYMKIVMNSMSGGTSEEQTNNITQIIKNVSKASTIKKNTISNQ